MVPQALQALQDPDLLGRQEHLDLPVRARARLAPRASQGLLERLKLEALAPRVQQGLRALLRAPLAELAARDLLALLEQQALRALPALPAPQALSVKQAALA